MSLTTAALARPPIIMSETEADRLSVLALQMEPAAPLAARLLMEEIDRAELREDGCVPPEVVRMHSTVQFIDGAHGRRRTVLLVYPQEADIEAGKVSVLTPVGAGLIGLSAHQVIQWPDRDGHDRPLTVLQVRPPQRLML
jgi:regulator of nucleoside diphosphate kinase